MSAADLTGRVAIITGGGSGMGRAHGFELARHGAVACLGDVDAAAAATVAEEIRAAGGRATSGACDVTDAAAVEAFVAQVVDEHGGVDVAVSNAGIKDRPHALLDTTEADWRRQFAVHVDCAFHLVKAALPALKRSPAGRIVLVSSEWAQTGPGFAHGYTAAKGALLAFGRNLAVELAPDGILVNIIAPGTIRTPMVAVDSPELLQRWAAAIPLGRLGEPEEVARLVAFLASEASSFITGQTIPINGGAVIAGS